MVKFIHGKHLQMLRKEKRSVGSARGLLLVAGAERGYLGTTLQQRPGLLPRDGRMQHALSRNRRILLPTPRRPCLLPWALALVSVLSAVAAVPESSGSWASAAASGCGRSMRLPALGLEGDALEAG